MKKFISLMLLASTACTTVGPNYRALSASQLNLPEAYGSTAFGTGAMTTAPSQAELATWWTQFEDPLLNQLVGRGLGANLDLEVARARLRQARESAVQARAGRSPTVGVAAGSGQSLDSGGDSNSNFSLDADVGWEADLFGGITRSIEAAGADVEARAYDLAAVQVALIADIASNYTQARLAQQREALARETLAMTEENLQIAEWRLQAGLVSSIDVEQARGQRAQTAASIPAYEQDFASAAYRLGVLTGQAPAAMVNALEMPQDIPDAPEAVAAGIPADTLRQRPDVRAAERNLAAQTARIGIAEAQLRPSLRLSGNIGTSALSIGSLVDLITGSLFASLSQTLFDGGQLESQVRSQEAATQAAFAIYKQSLLTAVEDVENGLVAVQTSDRRQADLEDALDAAQNQAILARSEYRAGLTDFRQLLEAERSLISARDSVLSNRANQTLSMIQLYRALGGGWSPLAA